MIVKSKTFFYSTKSLDLFFIWIIFMIGWKCLCIPVPSFQDVLDSMWGILRTRYSELGSPFITESQQDALLQGMAELVKIGKEKLARDHLQQTKSKVALQAQIQNHKVRYTGQITFSYTVFLEVNREHPFSSLVEYTSFIHSFNKHLLECSLYQESCWTLRIWLWMKADTFPYFMEFSVDWEDIFTKESFRQI